MVQRTTFRMTRSEEEMIASRRRWRCIERAIWVGLTISLTIGLASCSVPGTLPKETRGIWLSDGDSAILDIGTFKLEYIEQTSISCVLSEAAYDLDEFYDDPVDVTMPEPDELQIKFAGGQINDYFKRISLEEY